MRIGSLFSGIGGLELGLEWAGVGHTVWQVECEPFCRRVLAKHWPNAQRFDDVTKVGAHNLPPVEVICGGFPCQDISYAGKGAGLAGERSGLWFEYARIVRELRPRFVVVENVSALFTRGLDAVLGTLASLGYDAEWSSLRASDVGAAHRRDRVFVVAWLADAVSFGPGRLDDAKSIRAPRCGARVADPTSLGPGRVAHATGGYDAYGLPAGRPEVAGRLAACGEVVADAGCGDVQRWSDDRGVPRAKGSRARKGLQRQRGRDAFGDGRSALAHGDGGRLKVERLGGVRDRERASRGNDAHRCDGPRHSCGSAREQADQGPQAQSGVGGAINGLFARLDVARPGEPQADWEAPRVVTQAPDRAARLRALGNAVVPQVAALVGRRLLEIAEREGLR